MAEVTPKKGFSVLHLVVLVVVGGVNAVLSIVSSLVPVLPGFGTFYLPIAFMMLAGVWFGIWAFLGGILSGVLYAPYWGMPLHFGAISGVSDGFIAFWPYVFFKLTKADPDLKSVKDYVVALITGVFMGFWNVWFYGMEMIYIFGWVTFEVYFSPALFLFSVASAMVLAVPVFIILCKALSGLVKRTPMYVRGWLY